MSELAAPNNHIWGKGRLLAFRFASAYLLLSLLTVYGVLQVIPVVGYRLEGWIDQVWQWPVQWIGIHVFHFTGVAAQFHDTDSRDTALSWLTAGLIFPASIVIALIWSVLDRARNNYRSAEMLLRYILRLALIFLMFRYAIIKIFPLQMPRPSIAVLNEAVGETSPMTLLWTAIGLHPAYEMAAGWIEGLAALLLLFRRTALVGSLLTIFMMTDVLLYNVFFDVPVKLGALNVLILACALVVPDVKPLWTLFILHRPQCLSSLWAPPAKSASARLAYRAGEILLAAFALFQFVPPCVTAYAQMKASLEHPSSLTGRWRVDSAARELHSLHEPLPVLTGLGQPMIELVLEPTGTAMARAADGMLWRAQAREDPKRGTLTLGSAYFEGTRFSAVYTIDRPGLDHIVLRPFGPSAATNGVLRLTRIPTPDHYPLLDERSHWINEWALER